MSFLFYYICNHIVHYRGYKKKKTIWYSKATETLFVGTQMSFSSVTSVSCVAPDSRHAYTQRGIPRTTNPTCFRIDYPSLG